MESVPSSRMPLRMVQTSYISFLLNFLHNHHAFIRCIMRRGVKRRCKGSTILLAPNHCWGHRKSQQCHKYFLQCNRPLFPSERLQARTWGAKGTSCPRRHLTSLCPWSSGIRKSEKRNYDVWYKTRETGVITPPLALLENRLTSIHKQAWKLQTKNVHDTKLPTIDKCTARPWWRITVSKIML